MFNRVKYLPLALSAAIALSTMGLVLAPHAVIALSGASSKIDFKCAKPDDSFSLEGSATQGTYSKGGKVWLTFASAKSGQKLGFKNDSGAPLGFIKCSQPGKWKVEDATGKDLFVLEKEADGRYKFKDASDKILFEVKNEQYGLKIEDAAKMTVFKVHKKDDKLVLKASDSSEVFSTNASVDPIVVACFGFSSLNANQKAALAYAVSFLRN